MRGSGGAPPRHRTARAALTPPSPPTAPRLQNVFPRKKFPKVERAIDSGSIKRGRMGSLKSQWINETLRLRRQMFAFYGKKLHGWSPALEQRADVVLMRAGLAPTIPAARQRVNHRQVTLNAEPLRTPAARVNPGDVIFAAPALREQRTVPKGEDGNAKTPDLKLRYAELLWASLMSEQAAATHTMLRTLFPALSIPPGGGSLRRKLDLPEGDAGGLFSPAPAGPAAPGERPDEADGDHVPLAVAASGKEQAQMAATAWGRGEAGADAGGPGGGGGAAGPGGAAGGRRDPRKAAVEYFRRRAAGAARPLGASGGGAAAEGGG